MYKRTTPSFIFVLPDDETYDIVEITFKQGGYCITKTYEDGTLDDGMYITLDGNFAVQLTQEETNGFDLKSMARAQVRVKTSEGAVLASEVYKVIICDSLSTELL